VVVDNMVYIFGGFNSLAAPYEIIRTDRFNPTTNAFTQIGNLSLARSYLNANQVDGAIYAFGGTVFDGANLVAQTRTEKMADPGGAGTWDNAAVAEMPTAGAEGRAFGFDTNAPNGITNKVILAPAYAQWPGDSANVVGYDVAANTYDDAFPDLIMGRRNHADAFVPICTPDPADGLPAMWVIGGRCSGTNCGGDSPPYAGPEFFPLACPTAPTAAFTSNSPVCLGDPMQFTDESTGAPTAWFWEFGDGVGTSGEQNPVYTYTTANDFVVTLLVTNALGSDDVTGTVTVEPLPAASFDYNPHAGQMPLTVYFTNTSPVGTNPQWEFGDGGTDTGDFVNHTYVATGTYIVQLTVETALCGRDIATGTVVVTFEAAPIASFTADPASGCGAPLDVQFTDTSVAVPPATAWHWDFGDGNSSIEQNPLHSYLSTGVYTVTFVVTNNVGSDTATGVVSVYDLPVATFDRAPGVGYAPLTVAFTNTSQFAENAVWDFGDGSFGAGDNVTHTYVATGTFTVVLTVTSPYQCGEATAQAQVQVLAPGQCLPVTIEAVNQTPTGCVVAFDATLLGDPPYTYLWNFGSFGTFTESAPTVDFGATGTYTGTLAVSNCDGTGNDTFAFEVSVTCQVFKIYLPLIFKGAQ